MNTCKSDFAWSGYVRLSLQVQYPENVKISTSPGGSWSYDDRSKTYTINEPNGFVSGGLGIALDRLFGLSGPPAAISHIGVSSNTTAVTGSTIYLNGGTPGAAANTILKAISPAASRTGLTVTGGATFTNSDFTGGVFVINKIGFFNTGSDNGTGLIDVIGGSGGTDPYSRTFSVDFTNAGSFTLVPQIAVTAAASKASFPSGL